jgi:hypothetical protein
LLVPERKLEIYDQKNQMLRNSFGGNWRNNLRPSKGAGVYDGISTGRTKWAKNVWRKHPFAA